MYPYGMREMRLNSLTVDAPEIAEVLDLLTGEILPAQEAIGEDYEKALKLRIGRVKPISGKVFKISSDALRCQWRKARVAIGAPDLRIHDLRHEATSRLFEDKGFNVIEAAAVTGHKNLQMLKRYTHLDPTQLAKKLG